MQFPNEIRLYSDIESLSNTYYPTILIGLLGLIGVFILPLSVVSQDGCVVWLGLCVLVTCV